MRQIISAGAVIFRRDHDGMVRFLLLYHGGGYWNFPKGKLEAGERATTAFLREVEEETGIRRNELRLISGFRETDRYVLRERKGPSHRDEPRGQALKIVIYYLVETRKREIAISHEHDGFGWFVYRDAVRMARYKNTQEILKRVHEFIESNLRRHPAHPPRQSRHVR
jgi:8-oxo-dGTP pyrophosphatase MutT (NUDIX family)